MINRAPSATVLLVHSAADRPDAVRALIGEDHVVVSVQGAADALAYLVDDVVVVLCEAQLSTSALEDGVRARKIPLILLDHDTTALELQDRLRELLETTSPRGANRRQHPRVAVSIPVSIGGGGGDGPTGALTDLSVGGVLVKTPTSLERKEIIPLSFTLAGRNIRADAEVLDQREDGWSLRFVGLSHEDLFAFREFLAQQRPGGVEILPEDLPALHERIQDTVRAGNLMRSLIAAGATGWIRGPKGDAYPIRPTSFRGKHDPPVVRWVLDEALPLSLPVFVEVEGPNARYWFPVFDAVIDGVNVDARLADWFLRTRRRVAMRRPATDALSVRFVSEGKVIDAVVKDLSRRGLGFPWPDGVPLPERGMALANFSLSGKDGLVNLQAEVRSVSGEDGPLCGVRVVPKSRADHIAWNAVVNPVLSPTTRLGHGQAEEIWQLCVESGYFALSASNPGQFEPLRDAFMQASARIDGAPEVAAQLVWPATGPAEATVSVLRVHHGTWLACHLAKRAGREIVGRTRRSILRELFTHAYEHVLVHPEPQWFVSSIQEAATVGRLTQVGFAEKYKNSAFAALFPFRVWEIPTVVGPPPEVEVGAPTPGEVAAIVELIAANRPAAYVEALDFTALRLSMTALATDWAGAGLDRRRDIVVARVDGVARAVAIREIATDGIHLFRLLDCVRVFPMVACNPACIEALLRSCNDWYAQQGRTSWVYIEETEQALDEAVLRTRNARDLGKADLVIVGRSLLSDIAEFVFEVTAEQITA